MSAPERLKPYTFKKGVSGNPGGRPRIPDELKNIAKMTDEEVRLVIAKYCRMNKESIQKAIQHPKTSMFELNIAAGLVSGAKQGDLSKIAYLLERTIGKVKDQVEVHPFHLENYREVSNTELEAIYKGEDGAKS